jgi:hypothetical protein
MHRDKDTAMGGVGKAFLTTHWSFIEEVGGNDDDRMGAGIGRASLPKEANKIPSVSVQLGERHAC